MLADYNGLTLVLTDYDGSSQTWQHWWREAAAHEEVDEEGGEDGLKAPVVLPTH